MYTKKNNNVSKKEVKKVAPDGGWGYMICVGYTIIYLTTTTPANSIGMLFADLISENENGAKIFTTVSGIGGVLISLSGVIVNFALRWLSLRQICFVGALAYITCWISNIFVTNVYQLFFTYGFLNGFGFGIMNIVSYIVFNSYFVKNRVMMMSICMAIVGAGSIAAPFVVEYLLKEFSFRGTMMILAAFTMNILVGISLYQPVKWHLKEERAEEEEEQIIFSNNNYEKQGLLARKKSDDKKENLEEGISLMSTVYEKSNLRLFKNIKFCNLCVGIPIGTVGDFKFCMLLPLLLNEYGIRDLEAAQCISIILAGDLMSRLLLILAGRYINIKTYNWFNLALILTTLFRIVLLQFNTITPICVILGVLGLLRGWIFVFVPLIVAEEFPDEDYGNVFGVILLFNGLLNVIVVPILGIVKDSVGSFIPTFYMLALIILIPNFVFIYETCTSKARKKKNLLNGYNTF